jgi:hypothetical protein
MKTRSHNLLRTGFAAAAVAGGLFALKAEMHTEKPGPTKSELEQIKNVGDAALRAQMIEKGTLIPIDDSTTPDSDSLLQITIKNDKGQPEERIIHIVQPHENASEIVEQTTLSDHSDSDVAYVQNQGTGPGHELMQGDVVLLPEDAAVAPSTPTTYQNE